MKEYTITLIILVLMFILLGLTLNTYLDESEKDEQDPIELMTYDIQMNGQDVCWLTPADTVKKTEELECIVDGEYAPLWECYYPRECETMSQATMDFCSGVENPYQYSSCDRWIMNNI